MLEDKGLTDPTMVNMQNPNASASGTYQMLIMKGVFGGMKERCLANFKDGFYVDDMAEWLIKDAADCIKKHGKEMTAIIRGLKHTTEKPNEEKLKDSFKDLLTRWIFQLFRKEFEEPQYKELIMALPDDNNSEVMREAGEIISSVMDED